MKCALSQKCFLRGLAIVVFLVLPLTPRLVWGQAGNSSNAPALLPESGRIQDQLPLPAGTIPANVRSETDPVFPAGLDPDKMLSPRGLTPTLKLMILLTLITLAPSILIMTTCFIRIIIVLALLRQALGTQQLPPNQVLLSISMFLTIMVMWPVWKQAYENGIRPYSESQFESVEDQQDGLQLALERSLLPIRQFMSDQIFRTGNENAIWMFIEYQRPPADSPEASTWKEPENFDEIHTTVLIPAFILSELKTAFIIGFQIYLPFIVIDMVVASVLISMGMMMLPPVMISLPFKLLLFILVDGWYLVVEMLLQSVHPYTGSG